MKILKKLILFGAMITFPAVTMGTAQAIEIKDQKQCYGVIADTREAISSNPDLSDKSEKILLEVMDLAQKRCDEDQLANAKDLLDLARGMVASE